MEKREKVWLGTTMVLSLYALASVPFYLSRGDTLEGHPIFGAFFLLGVLVHGGLLALALIFQWIGVLKSLRWSCRLGFLFTLLGMLELAILLIPILVILPVLLLELFIPFPKK